MFITVFTRASTGPYLKQDQSSPYHPILSLSIDLRLGLPSDVFPSGFSTNILYAFLFYPFVLLALPISSRSKGKVNINDKVVHGIENREYDRGDPLR
jgi:hypothetical protein